MNKFSMKLTADIRNDAFARTTVAAFCLPLNPTVEELSDIKTAVSEAFTNCAVHAYEGAGDNYVDLEVCVEGDRVIIVMEDSGCGIEDVNAAVQPFFTTKPEQERSGMGFTLMKSFTDSVTVSSEKGRGTRVVMEKTIGKKE